MTAQQTKPRRDFADTSFGRFLIWLVEATFTVALLVSLALGVYNVVGPGDELLDLAKVTACQDEPAGCGAMWTMWERRPWVQTLRMAAAGKTKQVECRREYIVYGPWSCTWTDNPKVSPAASASAAPSAPAAPTVRGSAPTPTGPPKAGNKPRTKPPAPDGAATLATKPAATAVDEP